MRLFMSITLAIFFSLTSTFVFSGPSFSESLSVVEVEAVTDVASADRVSGTECKNPHVSLEDGSVRPATPEDLASDEINVMCCCNTTNGMCCEETSFCSGFIPGCFCTGYGETYEGERS